MQPAARQPARPPAPGAVTVLIAASYHTQQMMRALCLFAASLTLAVAVPVGKKEELLLASFQKGTQGSYYKWCVAWAVSLLTQQAGGSSASLRQPLSQPLCGPVSAQVGAERPCDGRPVKRELQRRRAGQRVVRPLPRRRPQRQLSARAGVSSASVQPFAQQLTRILPAEALAAWTGSAT